MRIVIMVEGRTERSFMPFLRKFLEARLAAAMPKLSTHRYDGRIPKAEKLRRTVENLLADRRNPADAVIALTDVYTGTRDFTDAADAKSKMRNWVGNNPAFHPPRVQGIC